MRKSRESFFTDDACGVHAGVLLFSSTLAPIYSHLSFLLPLLLLDRRCIRIWVCSVKILARMYVRDALVHSTFTVCARACVWASWVKVKPVLGVAEVGRIRVTDQRSRVSRRTRGEEALGPIESAYREQNGVPACLPAWLPACLAWIYSDPFSPSLSLSLFSFSSLLLSLFAVSRYSPLDYLLLFLLPLLSLFFGSLDLRTRFFFLLLCSELVSKAFPLLHCRAVKLFALA